MPRTSSAIPIACFVALAAFLVAMLAGSLTGNAFSTVVGRALFALLVAWPLGWIVGLIVEHLFATDSASSSSEDALEASGGGIVGEQDANFIVDELSAESDVSGVKDSVGQSESGVATGPS